MTPRTPISRVEPYRGDSVRYLWIPDTQRAQCAVKCIKSELRTELENVLRDAQARFGSSIGLSSRISWLRLIVSDVLDCHYRAVCD